MKDIESVSALQNWIEILTAFVFSALLFSFIQFAGPNIVDYDGYYHIQMARLIREHGLPTSFPYLPFTILDENGYTDHHMLLHVVQIPFTYLGDLRVAAKLSAVFCSAFAFATFFWLLRKFRIPYPWLWLAFLFASSSPFLYRMSMPRAPSLSLALQLIASYFILEKRYTALAVLSMIFVWTYNAFPTVGALVLIGIIVHGLTEKHFEYKFIPAVGIGLTAGLVINPYFPRNVLFLWNHIVPKIFSFQYQTSVGSEWYPYSSWFFFSLSAVAVLSYLFGVFWTNRNEWLLDRGRLFWFLTASLYLFSMAKSRRFVEYFPPSAILFLAFATRESLSRIRPVEIFRNANWRAYALAGMILLLAATVHSVLEVRGDVRREPDSLAYKGGSEWLAENTPAGDIVFNTDWDDFPMLFHYNTHNRYIVGLDADFMKLKDGRLYEEYEKITRGKWDDPADEIVKDYNARFVISDNKHKDFLKKAGRDHRFHKRYSDDSTTIFEIVLNEKQAKM